jgi:hypothetical protein
MDKTSAKVFLNILMDISGWEHYFNISEYMGVFISEKELLFNRFDRRMGRENIILCCIEHILQEIVFKNVECFNKLFIDYNNKYIINKIENSDFYIDVIKRLTKYATTENVPIMRFSQKRIMHDTDPFFKKNDRNYEYSTHYMDTDRYKKGFIMFVDTPNINLNNIKLSNQFINVLAHEIGHSMDVKFDGSKKFSPDWEIYIVNREIKAWRNAKKILEEISIFNTDIDLHSNICIDNYKRKYIK